jgi:hypothetical protein
MSSNVAMLMLQTLEFQRLDNISRSTAYTGTDRDDYPVHVLQKNLPTGKKAYQLACFPKN